MHGIKRAAEYNDYFTPIPSFGTTQCDCFPGEQQEKIFLDKEFCGATINEISLFRRDRRGMFAGGGQMLHSSHFFH
jgi:hypothetical protein